MAAATILIAVITFVLWYYNNIWTTFLQYSGRPLTQISVISYLGQLKRHILSVQWQAWHSGTSVGDGSPPLYHTNAVVMPAAGS